MPTLYVAATPIGNLSDASPRLLNTLRSVALIAAEDTRVTGSLLKHFGISKPMTSLHRHNEAAKTKGLVQRMLEEDIDVALVTDAGTPAISDPGCCLVDAAHLNGICVIAIAGPSAMAAALSVSGFDAGTFTFYGFLPREKSDLTKKLLAIAVGAPVALVYESPYRVIALMETVAEILPGCRACVCCDLTKLYEKTIRGSAEEVLFLLQSNPKAEKGEYCIVLDFTGVKLPQVEKIEISNEGQLLTLLYQGVAMQDAMNMLCIQGVRRNEVKRAAIQVHEWLRDDHNV